MRVLHVDSGRTYRGGQRQLLLLASAQHAGVGHDIEVLAACPTLAERLRERGVRARRWTGPGGPGGLLALARALTPDFDVVHVHDSRAHGAVAALRPSAVSRLVVHRRIDDVPRDRATTRWKYRRGRFVCVSEAVAAVLATAGVGADRIHVVPSAVEIPAAAPDPRRPGEPLRLLAVGALVPHKGHAVLLRALAACRAPCRLELAGDGPLLAALRSLAADLGLSERVRFAGDPRGEAAPLYEAADLLVHPSLTEGLGTAVLDALAAGIPVLASRAGGLPEAVGDGGWLVPPGDPAALASALDEVAALARRDPGAFGAAGRRGWEHVRRRHSIAAMAAGMDAVYDRLDVPARPSGR